MLAETSTILRTKRRSRSCRKLPENGLRRSSFRRDCGNTQLLAISESPDGTKLAVSDYGGDAIFLLDPDNPASATRYAIPSQYVGPVGLAVTNAGTVYFAANCASFQQLDTSTGLVTQPGITLYADSNEFCRVLESQVGGRVYANIGGVGFWVETSNDQIYRSFSFIGGLNGGIPEFSISVDGSTLDLDGSLADSSLNSENDPAYIDWETWFPTAVGGQKLNADGSILFQPLTDGIDMIARNTGRLLYRIQIPVTPANVYDPLFMTADTNVLGVITATGVSFVDLGSLPIASQYTQPFPAVTHTRTESPSRYYTRNAPQCMPALSSRAGQFSPRPRLRRRLEKSWYPAKTP